MKRLNFRLIVILSASLVAAGVCVFGLHRFQINRHAEGLLRRADLAEDAGETRTAIANLSRYVQQRPEDAAVFARMAMLQEASTHDRQIERREFQATSHLLEKAIRQNPEHEELRRRAAEFYLRFGRSKDAIDHLSVLSASEDSQTQLLLARAYAGTAEFDKAEQLLKGMVGYSVANDQFDVTLATAAEEIPAYSLLAEIYRTQRSDAALGARVIDACVQANPNSAAAYLARGRYRFAEARTAEADQVEKATAAGKADIRKAAEIAPEDENVIAAIADVELLAGNNDEAKSWLQRGIKRFPENENFYRMQANIALREKQPDQAAEILSAGLERLPDSWTLLLMRAEIDLANGDLDATLQAVKKLQKFPHVEVLANYLSAQVKLAQRKWRPASKQLEELLPDLMARRPDLGPQAYTALAQCYERLGQTDRQREANRQLLELKPTAWEGYYSEARALARLGRPSDARQRLSIAKRIADAQGIELPDLGKWEIALTAAEQSEQPNVPAAETKDLHERFLEEVNARDDLSNEQKAAIHVRFLAQQKQLEKAAEVLGDALKEAPGDEDLLLAQVDLAQMQSGKDRALKLLTELEAKYGDRVALRLRRAVILAKDATQQSISQLRTLEDDVDKFSTTEQTQLLRGLGMVYLRVGEIDQAKRVWRQVAKSNSDDLSIRLQLFELAVAQSDVELMEFAANEIRKITGPKSAYSYFTQAHQRLAVAGEELSPDNIAEVRSLLEKAESMRPNWHALNLLNADLDLREGNVNAAIDQLQAALENGPSSPSTVRRLVELLRSQRRFDEAREAIAQLDPRVAQSLGGRLRSQFELAEGDLASAIDLARRAAEESDDASDHLWLGRLLDRNGQPSEAIDAYRRAVQLQPEEEQPRILLLRALIQANLREEAEAQVREIALHVDPRRVDSTLGVAYEMLGETLLAKRHFEQAAHARPNDPAAVRDLAAFHLLVNEQAGALTLLDKLLTFVDKAAPADNHHIVWARRAKARLVGASGLYGDFRSAVKLLAANTTSNSWAPADLLLLAELTLPRDDPYALNEAIGNFESAADVRELSAQELFALGQLFENAGRWDDCQRVMSQAVAAAPKLEALVISWCDMQLRHGESGNVQRLLRTLNTESTAVKRVRARLYAITGRQDRAAELVRTLIPPTGTEGRVAAVIALARFLEEIEMNDEAERFYRAAEKAQPQFKLELAAFLARTGRLDEAFDLCEEQLSDRTIIAVTRIGIMGLTASQGKVTQDAAAFARVEDWIAKGLRDLPDSKAMQLHHAYLGELKCDYDLARQTYRQYLSRNDLTFQERAIASNNLAMLLAGANQCDSARRRIDKAIELVGPTAAMLDTRALVRLCDSDVESIEAAIEELQLARAVSSEPVIGLHLAVAFSAGGDFTAAQAALDAARDDGLKPDELPPMDRRRYDEVMNSLAVQTP